MVAFAQELIDAIIDHVGQTETYHSKDTTSLRACALTARSFVAPSQRQLFRTLTLKWEKMEKETAGLIENPHLASYIRDLELDLWFEDPDFEQLVPLFPLLSRLDRLIMAPGIWERLPANLRAALAGLLSLPSLRCFGLRYCSGVPASILGYALASYQEVAFTTVSFSEDHQFPVLEKAPSPAILRHLCLTASARDTTLRTFMLSKEAAISLSNLRYLELQVSTPGSLELQVSTPGSLGGLEEVALNYSSSIRHLAIDFYSASLSKLQCDILKHPQTYTIIQSAFLRYQICAS